MNKKELGLVLVSSVASFLILVLVSLSLTVIYRDKIFHYFASHYLTQELGRVLDNTPSSPAPNHALFTQEAQVVATVEKASPAVISIVITKDVPVFESLNPFQDLFGGYPFNFFFQTPSQQNGTERREIGGGSGFVVSANGYVVTNRHVVNDEKASYTAIMADGKKYDVKILAKDPVLDIAILRLENASNLPYLTFDDSEKVKVGQTAIAIGNALGEFDNTVSVGIVSGLYRSITASDGLGQAESLDEVIQTDAAINPGNSGGPLLDLRGRVIGVNVAVARGSENIGFALPANLVRGVVESVKEYNKIIRPYLGVRYTEVTPALKEKNKLTVAYGALVIRGETRDDLAIIPGSPADKAGIVENDIILEIDGLKLDGARSLASVIRGKTVGQTVNLKIWHKGTTKIVTLKLEQAPE